MRVFLIVLMFLFAPIVSACAKPAAKQQMLPPDSQTKNSPPASVPANSVNGITLAAAAAGVHSCLDRIEQVSSHLTANTQSKFVMFLSPADAEKQFTSASIESQVPGLGVAYATMTAIPANDTCDALYETIAYWEKSCTDLATNEFSTAKLMGVVQQYISVLEVGNTVRIFLMPAGQGCVSIKKEVLY